MLSARIGATGQMDIDGLLQRESLLEITHQLKGVRLGIGLREFAIGIPGTGDHAISQWRTLRFETDLLQRLAGGLDVRVGHVREDEILPDG